jgi:hypothetical protein
LSASDRIDASDRRSYGWPGALNLVLKYPDLDGFLEVGGSGTNIYSRDEPAPIVSLIEGLSAELANHRAAD